LDELHVVVLVRSRMLPSLYSHIALNCCAAPVYTEAAAGVMSIEVSVGRGGLLPPPPPPLHAATNSTVLTARRRIALQTAERRLLTMIRISV
jgi:hypothetical protein